MAEQQSLEVELVEEIEVGVCESEQRLIHRSIEAGRKKKTRRGRKKTRIEYDEDGLKCSIKLRFCKGCKQWIVATCRCSCIGMKCRSPNISRKFPAEQEIFRKTLAYPVRSPSTVDEANMSCVSFEDENRSFYMSPDPQLLQKVSDNSLSPCYGYTPVDSFHRYEHEIDPCKVVDTDQFMKDDFENMYSTAISNSLNELTKKELIDKFFELDKRVADLESENNNKSKKYCLRLMLEQQELTKENENLKKLLEHAKSSSQNCILILK